MADELIITIRYDVPLPAVELGELFAAIARDYRAFTNGRSLVVSRIESGSIRTTLIDMAMAAAPYVKDAVEFAKGVKALADFTKLIKDLLDKVNPGTSSEQPKSLSKSPAHRTFARAFKMSIESNCDVELKMTSSNGDVIEAKITPALANTARKQDDISAVTAQAQLPLQNYAKTTKVTQIISDLTRADPESLSQTEREMLIEVLVGTLQDARMDFLIEQIASNFAQRGFNSIADAIRIRASRRNEPPLITTS